MKTHRKHFLARVPKGWKILLYVLVSLLILLLVASIAFVVWRSDYRVTNAAARATAVKPDSEMIGTRLVVPRNDLDGVKVNLCVPEHDEHDSLPALINIHGGGFVGNDADSLDTQSARLSQSWKSIVVAVNFTKPDVKSIDYGVNEIVDAVRYFAENAKDFNADTEKFSIISYSSGGFYAAKAAEALGADGFRLAGQILTAPFVWGLPDAVSSTIAPALFVLEPTTRSRGIPLPTSKRWMTPASR